MQPVHHSTAHTACAALCTTTRLDLNGCFYARQHICYSAYGSQTFRSQDTSAPTLSRINGGVVCLVGTVLGAKCPDFSLIWCRSVSYHVFGAEVSCTLVAEVSGNRAYMPRQFRPSVCLSVRLSHACIVSKRLNVSSRFFHYLIGPSF